MENDGLGLELFDDEFQVVFQEDDDPAEGSKDNQETPSDDISQESVAGRDEEEESLDKEPDESLPKLYSTLARALKEEGFFSDLELEENEVIDSFDKLGDKIKQANNKAIKDALGFGLEEVNGLTELQKEYLQALKAGIPPERFVESKQDEVAIDSLTDEQLATNEELRKEIITRAYMSKGISEEKAKRLAQTHIDLAEDLDEAKSARDEIKAAVVAQRKSEIEYQSKLREEQQKQYQEYEGSLKKQFFEVDKMGEIFDVPKQLRDRMYESISKPVAKTEDGTLVNAITKYQMENPIEFQHKLAWFYSITDGFKKFDTFITKKATSAAAKQLESVLNSTNFDRLGNVSNPGFDDNANYGVKDFRFDEEA
jgi:hypothetical protein